MKSLLVCFAVVAVAFADEEAAEAPAAVLPALTYGHLPYAYHYGAPLTYTVPAPVQYKYVPKEVEIEVKTFQPEVTTTGCVNVFGTPVPCRAKRDADEAAEAEEAAPAAATLPYYYAPGYYGAPLAYAHHAAPLAYAHHLAAPVVTYAKPVVQEIEVPTPVYKNVVEKVPLAPLCQNHLGLAVPCA